MKKEYSVEICKKLETLFHNAALYRPMRVARYDAGKELVYDMMAVERTNKGKIRIVVDTFVGGGFAGQVYRVKVIDIRTQGGPVGGLEVGGIYAMKILVPPSNFSRLFRNTIYWMGFQGPFQLQVNPSAARAGALWQKFIRRGAKVRFGNESTIVDIHATFVDSTLGSCGELSEWVDGRTWRLEVDDRLDLLKQWRKGKAIETTQLGSPEYRAKFEFMQNFVKLLHDMGGYEFARQYEWSTCKSQPNCLKRQDSESNPAEGLTAVDFRSGLALLPFLPMSPGDFKLIFNGLKRGSLVQFDRGSLKKLESFMSDHNDDFADMKEMLEELKTAESAYRHSVPDITHNHVRLLYSRQLWSSIISSTIQGWKIRNIIDDNGARKLGRSRALTLLFFLMGLIPFVGTPAQRIMAQRDWRKHYGNILTSWRYLRRAFKGRAVEKAIVWYRSGRVDRNKALKITESFPHYMGHLSLSLLPVGTHRFMTDWPYARERLIYLFVRPIRLYFDSTLREQWLREMVTEGQTKRILSDEDAKTILSQVNEPFIQKYLKSLAVHVCTLPVTQVVSVFVAILYIVLHPDLPRAQAWGIGLGIIALFQVVPVSPGSLVRGLYVVYLVVKERNFKDYNIAVFLGFFKYIGYLAFPIQMTYRYPVLARFMASHWANESVHIVPVFGESGALLEHWVFRLFYNWPLTIRRRIQQRMKSRESLQKRYWHIGVCTILGTAIFGISDVSHLMNTGMLPGLKTLWWLSILVPLLCGAIVTLGYGGAKMSERISGAAVCGAFIGLLPTTVSLIFFYGTSILVGDVLIHCVWRMFIFSMVSSIGAIITEINWPDPDI